MAKRTTRLRRMKGKIRTLRTIRQNRPGWRKENRKWVKI